MSRKRALCVGIDSYAVAGSELGGCAADAEAWATVLTDHLAFASDDVRVLLNRDATKHRIMDELEWLLGEAAEGDVLVMTVSSHGTYVVDESGDEERYDEALCPHDVKDNLLVDDELRAVFGRLPDAAHVVVIADACHSGTATRAASDGPTADDRRVRFLNPSLRGGKTLKKPFLTRRKHTKQYPESDMREVVLSGCRAIEYSYEARLDGTQRGVMTHFALETLREADYRITYEDLHQRTVDKIEAAGFPQHPQLEGRASNKRRTAFR